MSIRPRAIIADDEPHLASFLQAQLERLWPQLDIAAVCANGVEALAAVARERPDLAFLDIRMPGLSGLEVAARLSAPCHLVFVTAYDEYAIDAFEREAADYLLKPVADERLARTVARLKERLQHNVAPADLRALISQLAAGHGAPERLRWIRAGVGESVRMIPVEEVCYFEAADKYTRVITAQGESLIRTPIKDLIAELDPALFWQVHRSTLVNARRVLKAHRDLRGRLRLVLSGCNDQIEVSRGYAHLFRQM